MNKKCLSHAHGAGVAWNGWPGWMEWPNQTAFSQNNQATVPAGRHYAPGTVSDPTAAEIESRPVVTERVCQNGSNTHKLQPKKEIIITVCMAREKSFMLQWIIA